MNSAKCLRDHGAEPQPARSVRVFGFEANEIAMVDELATGLATGVEARIAARALAMQSQQTKALDVRVVGVTPRAESQISRIVSPSAKSSSAMSGAAATRAASDDAMMASRRVANIVEAFDGRAGHQPNPRARSKSEESERFSCTPTLRGDRPSASPRS